MAVVLALPVLPVQAREREPNSVYAERRARLRAQVDGPVVLFGYTGREDASPSFVFHQENSFYYLTGHNEPGAALVLVPETPNSRAWNGPRETLFLPLHDPVQERWEGLRMAPDDPGVQERTGLASVEPFSKLRGELDRLSRSFPNFYTLLPSPADVGYPHARNWTNWLYQVVPRASLHSVAALLGAMRQVKSLGEIALITRAVELSVEAQLEAMKMLRPGLFEYEVAARMEYIHAQGGCERESYAPIVGAGPNSTVVHYSRLRNQIRDGDVVVLDAAGQYSGYSADITRTLPANGKFTPRQRELYEIVLGAQNTVLAAIKPGVRFGGSTDSLTQIAYDYLNSHGKDRDGRPLGRYFIHALGHHVGLDVQDVGDPMRPLEPGMVLAIEPGLYLPEENIGVRVEDEVLITATGYKLLSARLPRTVEEIEKVMAEARKQRELAVSSP